MAAASGSLGIPQHMPGSHIADAAASPMQVAPQHGSVQVRLQADPAAESRTDLSDSQPTTSVRNVAGSLGGGHGIPATALAAYQAAADRIATENPSCGLRWEVLAGIGKIESSHARGSQLTADGDVHPLIIGPVLNGVGPVAAIRDTDGGRWDRDSLWDRAVGPMQFIPGTWRAYGADGSGDGRADPHNIFDVTLSAGYYLCAGGADLTTDAGIRSALLRYNRSTSYVANVIDWINAYANTSVKPSDDHGIGHGSLGNRDSSDDVVAAALSLRPEPKQPPKATSTEPARAPDPDPARNPEDDPDDPDDLDEEPVDSEDGGNTHDDPADESGREHPDDTDEADDPDNEPGNEDEPDELEDPADSDDEEPGDDSCEVDPGDNPDGDDTDEGSDEDSDGDTGGDDDTGAAEADPDDNTRPDPEDCDGDEDADNESGNSDTEETEPSPGPVTAGSLAGCAPFGFVTGRGGSAWPQASDGRETLCTT